MDSLPGYYKYWGKVEKEGINYHLLPYHCLDVAAVVAAWWETSPAIRRSFCSTCDDKTEKQIRAWLLFFTALHDYGKFDIRFQLRSKPIWHLLDPATENYQMLPSEHDCRHYYHGEAGLFWFMQDNPSISEIMTPDQSSGLTFLDDPNVTARERWSSWKVWLEAVMGHHGHIKVAECIPDVALSPVCDVKPGEADRRARKGWLDALERLFLEPAALSIQDNPPSSSQLLAGLCSVSDWLGSRCDEQNFSYQQQPQDLEVYFEQKRKNDAHRILEFAGVISRPHTYGGVKALLDHENSPHSVQTLVDALPLAIGLTIVESPTGSGKTEAALAYAWRLIAAGLADSIVFALPTQATANAILERIEPLANRLFDEHPNVLLAHGSARFNKAFAAPKHSALEGYEKEDGWVQCSEWLAESRKRVFLGQIGVCTVDQVLISVLPVRHRFVRGFGLGRSVLIVDEVHAYDAYMYGLLEEVLRKQRESGGAAILLSATLPESQRRQLCAAWPALPKQPETKSPYPLVTWTRGDATTHLELDPSQLPDEITIIIEPMTADDVLPDEKLLRRMIAAAAAGAQVAVVCNLVDVAQGLARKLRSLTSTPVDLFHARYCYRDRQEKELEAIQHFGPKGQRLEGRILVATQVIEQSLDVDFDWLITQLCPVDLLFQRMGRLHRHVRRSRPAGFEKPSCTIILPKGGDYGLHGLIYANTRVLWRTATMLLAAQDGKIVFPDAYRTWIESCYEEKAWGNEPETVEIGYEKFESEIKDIQRYKARYMVETAMNPFADTDEHVTAVTRDGEMNLIVVPFCRSTKGKMLMDGTIFELQDEYGRLECLALNSIGVPKSWRRYFGEPDEGRCWLEMKQDGEGYVGRSKNVAFHYRKDMGLEKEK
jgi:CRISPR-associated endonuclease/helicase Cas3